VFRYEVLLEELGASRTDLYYAGSVGSSPFNFDLVTGFFVSYLH